MTELLTIPSAAYHADNIEDRPSLSAGLVSTLCNQSPAHAWARHPKLNPDFRPLEEPRFDVGTAAHCLFLEGRDSVHIVAALDWRTKDAKLERDYAREMGKVPLLTEQWAEVQLMCEQIRPQLDRVDASPPLFTDGKPEQTLVWEERGVLCRARLDWLRDDLTAIDDLKTTSRSASPESWSRTLFSIGADVQMAFYLRGLRALIGEPTTMVAPQFRWAVVETAPPYALSVFTLAPGARALAEAKVDHALQLWRDCLERDNWPAYPTQIAYADAPPWEMTRWLERTDEVVA